MLPANTLQIILNAVPLQILIRFIILAKKADIITIEIEKVNIEALDQLEKEGKQVYPQARVIRLDPG